MKIAPNFLSQLNYAEAYHDSPKGKITLSWKREGETVAMHLTLPEGMKVEFCYPCGMKELSKRRTEQGYRTIIKL